MPKTLKDLRIQSGYKTVKILEELGVVRSTLYFWEIGRFEPNKLAIEKLAKIYNVSVDDIRGCLNNARRN